MSQHIEWVDADAVQEIDQSFMPGYFADGHGSVNTGTALAFAGVVLEGSIEELEDFVVRMSQAIDTMKDEIAAVTDDETEEYDQ